MKPKKPKTKKSKIDLKRNKIEGYIIKALKKYS